MADKELYNDNNVLIINDDDKVSQWNDLSGNNNHATSEDSYYDPVMDVNQLNNKPSVRFDGEQFMNLPDNTIVSGNNEFSMFAVVRTTTISEERGFLSAGSPDAYYADPYIPSNSVSAFGVHKNANLAHWWWGSDLREGAMEVNTPILMTTIYNSSTGSKLYNLGALLGSSTRTDHNTNSINNKLGTQISYYSNSNGGDYIDRQWKGDVAEIAYFNTDVN